MKFYTCLPCVTLLFFIVSVNTGAIAQASQEESDELQKLSATILHHDSIFWQAYNACDVETMGSYFTEDIEFYHDKGGLTTTKARLIETTKNGLCSSEDWRLRREVVRGSLEVYPLNDYGAILSGEHRFYIIEKGKERLDGLAKFTHVWQYKDNAWRMSRVLSYDHGPAPHAAKDEIMLAHDVLQLYEGTYEAPQSGSLVITIENDALKLQTGKSNFLIYPEGENVFFLKERDVRFEFVKNDKNEVLKMIVRENGDIVEEAIRTK